MTLNIEVSGELEKALKEQAREQGFGAERVERRVLAQVLTPSVEREEDGFPAASGMTGEEKARAFVRWAEGRRDTPPLSDEAISRARLNPDHW